MTYKWIGAGLIIAGCGGAGFSIAARHRMEVKLLKQLIWMLQNMKNELQYRLLTLPELCRKCGRETGGVLGIVFQNLAFALDRNSAPDVDGCMAEVLGNLPSVPPGIRAHLKRLGQILGRFDLVGQIEGLQNVLEACNESLEHLSKDQDARLRSYQILGLCSGAALVILLV